MPLIPSGKIDKNELKTIISLLPEEENYHITLESWRRNNTGGTPNCRSWQHLPPPKPWAEPRGCAAGWASPRGPRRAQTQRKPSNKEPENQAIKNQHFVCRGASAKHGHQVPVRALPWAPALAPLASASPAGPGHLAGEGEAIPRGHERQFPREMLFTAAPSPPALPLQDNPSWSLCCCLPCLEGKAMKATPRVPPASLQCTNN